MLEWHLLDEETASLKKQQPQVSNSENMGDVPPSTLHHLADCTD